MNLQTSYELRKAEREKGAQVKREIQPVYVQGPRLSVDDTSGGEADNASQPEARGVAPF